MIDTMTGLRTVPHSVSMRQLPGHLLLTSNLPLDPVARRTADWLHRWAEEAPDRVFLSERAGEGWRDITYAGALGHGGLVQDVVVCGHDRDAIGLFIFPRPDQVCGENSSDGAVIDAALQARIEERLRDMAGAATGSGRRIGRAIILSEPPSLKDAEITDKGSLNVRRIIMRRAALLERLYDNEDPALIRV